jgi:hypothetical protein
MGIEPPIQLILNGLQLPPSPPPPHTPPPANIVTYISHYTFISDIGLAIVGQFFILPISECYLTTSMLSIICKYSYSPTPELRLLFQRRNSQKRKIQRLASGFPKIYQP